MDPDLSCGRCANVQCDDDWQCQTGECVDTSEGNIGYCYDPIFWIIILVVTLGVVFIIVALTTFFLVRKRRLERAADSTETTTTQS